MLQTGYLDGKNKCNYKMSQWKIFLSPIKPQNCVCDVIKFDVIIFLIFYIAIKHKTNILKSCDFWPLYALYISKILAFPEKKVEKSFAMGFDF